MSAPVPRNDPRPGGSFIRSLVAVAWSFFGIRKSADYEHDVAHLDPKHVVGAAILGGLGFVVLLILLVKWVLSSGIAAGG